jgi:restriction system protein
MKPAHTTIWGIRAGETGDADSLFFAKNVVALGLEKIGELKERRADRLAIKTAIATYYPGKTPSAVARNAGQLFHFFHNIVVGDLMVYPSRIDGQVHIGRVQGPYFYNPSILASYPHRRLVKWLVSVPRASFSQEALFEMGAATTLFQIRRHANEFWDAALKKQILPPPN